MPKGPTLDPAVKRLAVHVEDHPIEYLDFEGVIPSGAVRRRRRHRLGHAAPGSRTPTDDPAAAVAAGELHADMHGQKLRGRLVLVRTGHADRSGKEQWLLLHKHDEYAVSGWDPEDHPRSVLSGRTNDEVKADPDRLWRSDLPPAQASVAAGEPGRDRGPCRGRPRPGRTRRARRRWAPDGTWEVFGRALRLTNLDKVLFPARRRRAAGDQARAHPLQPPGSPRSSCPTWRAAPLNMHRFPNGAGTAGSGTRSCPATRPTGSPAGTTRTPIQARPGPTWSSTKPPRWCGRPTSAPSSGTPGPRGPTSPSAHLRADRHRPRRRHLLGRRAGAGPAAPHRAASTSASPGQPKVTGQRGIQIWIPVAPGPSFDETRSWTEQLSRPSAPSCPSW